MGERNQFEAKLAEYKELCENIREAWMYITTLLRQFLAVQIVLLSIVGLGVSFSGPAVNFLRDIQERGQVGANTSPGLPPSTSGQVKPLDSDTTKLARAATLFVFMAMGIALSWGAWLQSKRLFANAARFVDRAAEIEEELQLHKSDIGFAPTHPATQPTHIYMRGRLHDNGLLKMETVLSGAYLIAIVVWICLIAINYTALVK